MGRAALRRYSRIARTGFGFGCFGALAIGLALWLPLARQLGRGAPGEADERRAQRTLHRATRRYLAFLTALGVLRVSSRGVARLLGQPGPHLLVANHPTLVDFLVCASLLPQVDCIVSGAWARNPFLRRLVVEAGYIRNDLGPEIVEEGVRRLGEGRTLLVFPEGTRSPVGGLGRFQRGAAHLALASGVPPTPVLITCQPPALGRGQRWHDVPEERFHVTLSVGDPLVTELARDDGATPLAARRLGAELREYFEKRLTS